MSENGFPENISSGIALGKILVMVKAKQKAAIKTIVKVQNPAKERTAPWWIPIASLVVSFVMPVAGLAYQWLHNRSSDKRIGQLETSVRVLTETAAPQLYKAINDSLRGALDPDTKLAEPNLNHAQKIIAQLHDAKVRLDPKQLAESGVTLSQATEVHPELSSAWEAAGEMISYRSEQRVSVQSAQHGSCFGPKMKYDPLIFTAPYWTGVHDISLRNCTFDLSDVRGFWKSHVGIELVRLSEAAGKPVPFRLLFANVHVVYRGGPVVPAFFIGCVDCTFDFQLPAVPSAPGQSLVRQVLSADMSNVQIKLEINRG